MARGVIRAALPPLRARVGIRSRFVGVAQLVAERCRPCRASTCGITTGAWLRGGYRSLTSAAGTLRPVTIADLDAWAESPLVLGHAHSRPSSEPYEMSTIREYSGGQAMPSGWAVRLVSATGMKSSDTPNQDSFSYTLLDGDWMVCIACDGHGEEGDIVSERVARTLPLHWSRDLPSSGPEGALRHAFEKSQADLEKSLNAAQTHSGTTAAVVCIHAESREAWFAYVGDSKIALGDLATGKVVFSTGEHKAHDLEEGERLKQFGAQVITREYEDGELVSRVFVPGTGIPGLAMSRSLGDGCLKNYGVTAEPQVHNVTEFWQTCEAPVVVLASDGLWDTISVEETIAALAARCRAGLDVRKGCEVLLRRSQRLWIQAEGDYCDDVTVVLLAPNSSLAPCKPTG
mmetsp:Transcript_122502/g.318459  ORF Transcript_122502/g.318459 Transcript_122502/m.318459 type:complete len:402 (-) Transcript_122502:121-1326(-)